MHAEALRILRLQGAAGLKEIERLLGWSDRRGMFIREIAEALGITEGQTKYYLHRDYLRQKSKEKRKAESDAEKISFVAHTSQRLEFSIMLPDDWRVVADTSEWTQLAQEYLEWLRQSKPRIRSARFLARGRPSADGEMRSLTGLEEIEASKEEYDQQLRNAERHARFENMAVGLFQAEPCDQEDGAFIEITKLQLEKPLTSLELYDADKYLSEDVIWGNRPKQGMTVDGLSGVVYYYMMRYGSSPQNEPVFFNVYLTDGLAGWIVSCQSKYGKRYFKTFTAYKPIFKTVIGSFKRLNKRA